MDARASGEEGMSARNVCCLVKPRRGSLMSGPFIFIATNRLRQGRFDAERQRVPELSRFIEANEPRLIAFNEYVNEDHTAVTVVQIHPDAASMEFHLGVVGDQAPQAYAETLEGTAGIQVFGTPSDDILRMLRQQAGSGVPLTINAHHLGGFTPTREARGRPAATRRSPLSTPPP